MGDECPPIDTSIHRHLAADSFNGVWTLMELPERSVEQDDTMVHAAHASRYHWGVVGQPVLHARGEWQVSGVHYVLGRPEPALHHARRFIEHGIGDLDIAFADEALARACAVAGDDTAAEHHLAHARVPSEAIADLDDREHGLEDIATVRLSSMRIGIAHDEGNGETG